MISRALVTASLLIAVSAAPAAADFTPGAAGAGDPFFPNAGNGGYEVRHYSLKLDYEPQNEQLAGDVTIRARATQDLSSFNLDLRGFKVSSITVDGSAASFTRKDQELTITPSAGLRRNRDFTVRVVYAGHANYVLDPDKSKDGWIPTDDGAFVVNEPQGSPTWFPANDTPKDFATYDFAITVPEGRTALANGTLVSETDNGDTTTWRWREDSPMVTYLSTATNGVFKLEKGMIAGIPEYNAVDPNTRRFGAKEPNPQLAWDRLGTVQPAALQFLITLYGPYPFDSVGAIVDWAPNVFYSLESQTKPNYWHVPTELTIVHELAHMWFGDAVVLEQWPDMWLNEGFATWSEWRWTEHTTPTTAQDQFNDLYATPEDSPEGQDLWFPAPNNLADASELFHTPVYDRGAMTLQALRQKVGEETFLTIVRSWYAENRHSNVTTADFIALAERVSGQQLDQFFQVWLFEEGRPEPGSW
ncbi:MAG TPA: M1 family metallopeptidase [Thermoleophilaceae bacterium]